MWSGKSLGEKIGWWIAVSTCVAIGVLVTASQPPPPAKAQLVTQNPSRGQIGVTGPAGANGNAGIFTGTTGSIGGGLLSVGSCASGTATVTGATVGMATVATPSTYPGDGTQWQSYVSSANTVTVKTCAIILITPTASVYNVRVVP